MGIIVAIGGYEYESEKDGTIDTPLDIDKKILSLTKKKKARVLFIPTASSDKEIYINSIKKIYQERLGADFDTLLLHLKAPARKDIQDKIDWADVIYVGGGNTLMMMKKWRKLGVDEMLRKAYQQDKVLCGVSAGSICWFKYGISDSLHFYDDKEVKYIRVSGLGILKGTHCPHFGSKLWDKGFRTEGMKQIMKRSRDKCLAVPDGCAVIIKDAGYTVIGLGEAKLYHWSQGKWVKERVE